MSQQMTFLYLPWLGNRSSWNKEEVREDTIAEMKMEDLQGILKEDVDLIFDALVLHDYIEEVDA